MHSFVYGVLLASYWPLLWVTSAVEFQRIVLAECETVRNHYSGAYSRQEVHHV